MCPDRVALRGEGADDGAALRGARRAPANRRGRLAAGRVRVKLDVSGGRRACVHVGRNMRQKNWRCRHGPAAGEKIAETPEAARFRCHPTGCRFNPGLLGKAAISTTEPSLCDFPGAGASCPPGPETANERRAEGPRLFNRASLPSHGGSGGCPRSRERHSMPRRSEAPPRSQPGEKCGPDGLTAESRAADQC